MKHRNWISALWAAVLALTAVTGSIGCLISGMGLENIVAWHLAVSWLLTAAVFSLCYACRLQLYPMAGLLLLAGYLWQKGPLRQSVELLLFHISRIYDNGYGWGVLFAGDYSQIHCTTALSWVGIFIVILVTRAVIRRRGICAALAAAALPAVSCMVVTDTVPSELWLFLLLFAVILLLMTNGTRQLREADANRLTRLLLIPVALGLLLLFALVPREGYQAKDGPERLEKLEKWINGLLSQREPAQQTKPSEEPLLPPVTVPFLGTQWVSLRGVGPKTADTTPVMNVTAAKDGTLYLRGSSYDLYTGTAWYASGRGEDVQLWPGGAELVSVGDVTVSTNRVHDVLYLPYYPTDTGWYIAFTEGGVPNFDRLEEYTVSQAAWTGETGQAPDMSAWLELPQSTLEWAEPLAAAIGEDLPVGQALVERIGEYVRNSARYDLKTVRMPYVEEDFAKWFLEESETGYCVHFASSAAVLLRAAGVPARYVTGYMLQGQAKQPVQVLSYQSHAWVEYCLPGGVWQVLEATPPDYGPVPTQPTEQTQPGETEPEQTLPGATLPAPTRPGQTQETQPQQTPSEPEQPTVSSGFRKILAWALGVSAAVVLQWRLRVYLRRRYLTTGAPNILALKLWRQAQYLRRLLRVQPDKRLYALAQKAKFSQHTLRREELDVFREVLAQYELFLKQGNILWQLLYTLVLAIY